MDHFVIGDIHGCYQELKELLDTHWKPDREQLIFLGDLVDRGKKSYDVIRLVKELSETHKAIVLGGNHEDLFLDWLENPNDEDFYYNLGGRETVDSFFDMKMTFQRTPDYLAELLKKQFAGEINFLKERPHFYETEHFIFVHAGVNLAYKDWKNSNIMDFRWIREPFLYGKNETGKTIVFGHTPTRYLHTNKADNKRNDAWFSPCGTKIGLDGACVFGGYLHGLKITDKGMDVCSVAKKNDDI